MHASRAQRETSGVWTTRRLLEWTSAYLERKSVDAPRLSAELLLAHVLETPRIRLYTDLDRPAGELERAAYRELVERAAAHEPVAYLIGSASFFSMTFEVDSSVLIPRPSTETLLEHVIQHAKRTPGFASPLIVEIGTGSGCMGVALAKHLPQARVIATDISEPALELARRNAQRHSVGERIEFRRGSLYEPLTGGERVHYLISNPPYISDAGWERVASNVKDYEPTGALRGGADGLDVLRPLIAGAGGHLHSPGQLVLEIASDQKPAALDLAGEAEGLTHPRVLPDHEAHPRMLLAERE